MDNSNLAVLIKAIVSGQQVIIGPMAISEANKVNGIKISPDLNTISVSSQSPEIITSLVRQYEKLFGRASVEACRDSIKEIIPNISSRDIPEFLR